MRISLESNVYSLFPKDYYPLTVTKYFIMIKMMIKVNMNQEITAVSGADFLAYEENDLLGQQLEMIIPDRHRAGHHGGFNRFQATGVKKILGSWILLPALAKDGAEKNVNLVLTEEKGEDGSHYIIALMK